MFNSDGTIYVERHTLRREGFADIRIRKIYGKWEYLVNISANFDETWDELPHTEEQIMKNIAEYGIEE